MGWPFYFWNLKGCLICGFFFCFFVSITFAASVWQMIGELVSQSSSAFGFKAGS